MVTRVQRWGNSLAVRIPRSFAVQANVAEGSAVDISLEQDSIVVKPVRHHYRLHDLVKGIDRRNRHAEVRTGGVLGREVW